ncbi:MAG: zinc-ribbon domain-containing protein [Polyangiaceae bacterium]
MKFLCDNCKAKYQIGDEKVAGKTVRMKCRKCGHLIQVHASVTESSVARGLPGHTAAAPAGDAPARPPAPVSSPGSLPWPGAPAAPPRKPEGRPAPPETRASPRPGSVAARPTDTPEAMPREENDEEKTTIMSVPPRRLGPLPAAGRDDTGSPRSGSALGAFGMRSQAPGAPRPPQGVRRLAR